MWLLIDSAIRGNDMNAIAREPKAARYLLRAINWTTVAIGDIGLDILDWALDFGYLPEHVHLLKPNQVMGRALETAGYVPKMNMLDYFKNKT